MQVGIIVICEIIHIPYPHITHVDVVFFKYYALRNKSEARISRIDCRGLQYFVRKMQVGAVVLRGGLLFAQKLAGQTHHILQVEAIGQIQLRIALSGRFFGFSGRGRLDC